MSYTDQLNLTETENALQTDLEIVILYSVQPERALE